MNGFIQGFNISAIETDLMKRDLHERISDSAIMKLKLKFGIKLMYKGWRDLGLCVRFEFRGEIFGEGHADERHRPLMMI